MKKRGSLIALMLFVVLSGCKKDNFNFTENNRWDTKWHTQMERRIGHIVPYQNGFYYVGKPDCLSYFDIDSGQSVILCNKNGCSHSDKKCFAYIENGSDMPEIHKDKLYFISSDGEIYVANADNTEKKKEFTLLKDAKEKEQIVFLSEYVMTDEYLFFLANVTEYSSDTGEKTEERVYALNLESKEEILLDKEEYKVKNLKLISAYKDIVYYCKSDDPLAKSDDWTEMSSEEVEELGKNVCEDLYRRELKEKSSEKIREIEKGLVVAANDDIGVYYSEFSEPGRYGSSKLFRVKPGEKDAKLVYSTEDKMGFSFGEKNAEYLWIREDKKDTIYNLATMKPVTMEWEYKFQPAFAYKVPGGFAVPKTMPKDEETKTYLGEEYKFLYMQDEK